MKKIENKGFSLVEVSIVLIIMGLILGIVVSGKHLITQAKLKNVITEVEGYQKAVSMFRKLYLAWPGDMPNATGFWPDTTDGNDNQQITGDSGGPLDNEGYRAWQHLSSSELIKGSFDGEGRGNGDEAIIGANVPKSSLEGGGYFFHYWGLSPTKKNALTLGGFKSGTFNSAPALPPRDAAYIDRKIDDAQPRSGDVWAEGNGGTGACYTSNTYNLTSENIECALHFWLDVN